MVSAAQQTRLAAMEAMWETEPAPASFNVIALPNEAQMKNDYALHMPWVMGLIGTRSLDQQMPGIRDIVARNRERVEVAWKRCARSRRCAPIRATPNCASASTRSRPTSVSAYC